MVVLSRQLHIQCLVAQEQLEDRYVSDKSCRREGHAALYQRTHIEM
jgi:hypothetical protein